MWLAAPLLLLGGATEAACLDLSEEVSVEGTLLRAEIEWTGGQLDGTVASEQRTIYYLMPDAPGCAIDESGEEFSFTRIQVYSDLGDVMKLIERAAEKRVQITGEGFAGHTAHHHAPLMLKAYGLGTLSPGDLIPDHSD